LISSKIPSLGIASKLSLLSLIGIFLFSLLSSSFSNQLPSHRSFSFQVHTRMEETPVDARFFAKKNTARAKNEDDFFAGNRRLDLAPREFRN